VPEDEPDRNTATPYESDLATDPEILIYRISRAFFFGAAASVGATLDEIAVQSKAFIVDFSQVALLDSTAAATLDGFVRKAVRQSVVVYTAGVTKPVRRALMTHGVRPPQVKFRSDILAALKFARRMLDATSGGGEKARLPRTVESSLGRSGAKA
jgi:SulP family sulfate permease